MQLLAALFEALILGLKLWNAARVSQKAGVVGEINKGLDQLQSAKSDEERLAACALVTEQLRKL
jgi:hypothetical protein